MIRLAAALFCLIAFACTGLRAEEPDPRKIVLGYDGYAAAVPVVHLDIGVELTQSGYAVNGHYQTSGMLALVMAADQTATASGLWNGARVSPRMFRSDGRVHGTERTVQVDFTTSPPHIDTLTPPITDEREPVPPDAAQGSIDPLSVLALLSRQVQQDGRCDGNETTFDGRRVMAMTARTKSHEILPHTARSNFSGDALRCGFESVLTAGFPLSGAEKARAPRHGDAWFASPGPGYAAWPVQINFETPWVGHVTLYLTAIRAGGL